jgi:hypothetical protein
LVIDMFLNHILILFIILITTLALIPVTTSV